MTSELKSATARANGAKSRGPISPEGREKSSRNSITHGLTARKTMVLECESDDDFHEMLAGYAATYQPGSPVETNLMNEMAAALWRMMRLRMIEVALLDREMNRQPSPNDPQSQSTDPGYQMAAAFSRLVDESRALSFISRYESRLPRIHERSYRMLRELQQSRKQQTPEPVPQALPDQPEPPPGPRVETVPVAAEPEPAPPLSEPRLRLVRPDKKWRNEPTAAGLPARRHPQRLVNAAHRGIRRYLGTNRLRYLRRLRTA